MNGSILYMGDTSLESAAAYLAGLITLWDWKLDYVPSETPLAADLLTAPHSLLIISDYPASQISTDLQQEIVSQVKGGAGLLMIGGWESFHGLGGDWNGTPIGEALPIEIADTDDRLNCDHPVFVRPRAGHRITDNLPWDTRPPIIGGMNRVTARSDTTTLLTAEHYRAVCDTGQLQLSQTGTDPLLVVGSCGAGRTTALMTDVAPHWVGPLVDWGPERVTAQATGAESVEVGNLYARFLKQLLNWTSGN